MTWWMLVVYIRKSGFKLNFMVSIVFEELKRTKERKEEKGLRVSSGP